MALTLTAPLAGCAPGGNDQRAWVKRVQTAPGVEKVDWKYHDNWPTARSYHQAEVVVSPTFSSADAAEFARLSCEGGEQIDQISVEIPRGSGHHEALMLDLLGSCFDAEQLVRYATVLESINALRPELGIKAFVKPLSPERVKEGTPAIEVPFEVHIDSDTDEMFDMLQEIQRRNAQSPLYFWGTGDLGDNRPLIVQVSAGYSLEPVAPLLRRAFELSNGKTKLSDEGITIEFKSEYADDPALISLHADAEQAGIPVTVLQPDRSAS